MMLADHTQTVQCFDLWRNIVQSSDNELEFYFISCFSDMYCAFIWNAMGTTRIKILNIYSSKKVICIFFQTKISSWNMFID